MRQIITILLLMATMIGGPSFPSTAQDDDTDRILITPENVDQLVELQRFDRVTALLPTLSPDATMLAAESDDGVAIYSVESRELIHTLEYDTAIYNLRFSADSQQIAVASDDSIIRIFDVATETLLSSFSALTREFGTMEWSPDGQMLATNYHESSSTIQLWDVQTGTLINTFVGHTNTVSRIAFSADSRLLLSSSSGDNTARIWDVETGEQKLEVIHESVQPIALSPDGSRLATGALDYVSRSDTPYFRGEVKVWDTVTGAEMYTVADQNSGTSHLQFSENGDHLILATHDGSLKIVDAVNGDLIEQHDGLGTIMQLLVVSNEWIVQSINQTNNSILEIINASTDSPLGYFFRRNPPYFSPDLQRMFESSIVDAHLVDVESGDVIAMMTGQTYGGFSDDSQWFITQSIADRTITVWDADTGENIRQLNVATNPLCTTVTFTPDSAYVYCHVPESQNLWLWDLSSGTIRESYSFDALRGIVQFSQYGAVGLAWHNSIPIIFDIESGNVLFELNPIDNLNAVVFYENNSHVFALSSTGIGQLWDIHTGQKTNETHHLHGRYAPETSLLRLDQQSMVNGFPDSAVVAEPLPIPHQPRTDVAWTFEGHTTPIESLALSPDGSLHAAIGSDGRLLFWDFNTTDLLHELQVDDYVWLRFSSDGTKLLLTEITGSASIWGIPPD